MSQTLRAFTEEEFSRASKLLSRQVIRMMGDKIEESDWSKVYCAAKEIPETGWSNLNIDIVNRNIGIEHKMLRAKDSRSILTTCGTSVMHPSITRQIRTDHLSTDPNEAMVDIFSQYKAFLDRRSEKIMESSGSDVVEQRTGLLLWQDSLREFLYFEEKIETPNPEKYYATWSEKASSKASSRLSSKNLWIYDKTTNKKKYSITTSAGSKIQGYFDIPSPTDDNLYHFVTHGVEIDQGVIRMIVTPKTYFILKELVDVNNIEEVSELVKKGIDGVKSDDVIVDGSEAIFEVNIYANVYYEALEALNPVNDEHLIQQITQS